MTWGMVAVGVGTAVAGAYSASQANKAAGAAGARAEALYGQNMARLNEFDAEQKRLYGPLEQQLVQEAQSNQPLYYGQMAGQINAGTAAAERGLDTALAARGMSGSGVQAGGIQGLEIGKQISLDQAFQTGLQMRTALGQSVLQRYQPMFTQQLMSGATGQAANFAQNQQMLYGSAAAQGWGNVAKGLGAAAQAYAMSPSQATPMTTNAPGPGIEPPTDSPVSGLGIGPNGLPLPPGATREDVGSGLMSSPLNPQQQLQGNLPPSPNYNSTLGVGNPNGLNMIPQFRVAGSSTTGVQ